MNDFNTDFLSRPLTMLVKRVSQFEVDFIFRCFAWVLLTAAVSHFSTFGDFACAFVFTYEMTLQLKR